MLSALHQEISACHICPNMDWIKTARLYEAVNCNADVFILSQSLAREQLRLSGVNFFNLQGKQGTTGQNLEKFLNKFNRTTFPHQDILIGEILIKSKNLISVYNTELVQCYPGRAPGAKGDRSPTVQEIRTCVGKRFFIQELSLIKPKLLILMGRLSRNSFYQYILYKSYPENLSVHINQITETEIPREKIENNDLYILPIQHASGANPEFQKMLKNDKLIALINKIIN